MITRVILVLALAAALIAAAAFVFVPDRSEPATRIVEHGPLQLDVQIDWAIDHSR